MLHIEGKAKSAKPYMAKKLWLGEVSLLFSDRTNLLWHIRNITYVLLGEETFSHEPWLDRGGRESVSTEENSERL